MQADWEGICELAAGIVSSHGLDGASLRLARAGGPSSSLDIGNWSGGRPLLAASGSKWLSGALILAMADKGLLGLSETVGDYFPDAPEPVRRATVRQLVAHTSGLPGTHDGLGPRLASLDAVARRILGWKGGEPGEVFAYGGASMQVAGRIVEIAGGRTWDELFEVFVAGPLRMRDTHYGRGRGGRPGGNPRIGAGVRTTADDYLKFLEMLLAGGMAPDRRVLSPDAVQEMAGDQVGGARKMSFIPEMLRGARHGVYGLGCWRLLADEKGEVLASPGAYGFFPWLDRRYGVAGIFAIQSRRLRDARPHNLGAPIRRAVEAWCRSTGGGSGT